MRIYDLAIVGAGLAGITAARLASEANLSVLLLERGPPGYRRDLSSGWLGRFPFSCSKMLEEDPKALASEDIAWAMEELSMSGRMRWRSAPEGEMAGAALRPFRFLETGPAMGRTLAMTTAPEGCDVIMSVDVSSVAPTGNGFVVLTDQGTFTARKCLLAVGPDQWGWVRDTLSSCGATPPPPLARVGWRIEMPTTLLKGMLPEAGDVWIDHGRGLWSDDFWVDGLVGERHGHGFMSAMGHRISARRSGRTSFMVSTSADPDEAVRIAAIANVLSGDRTRRERASDLVRGSTFLKHIGALLDCTPVLRWWGATVPRSLDGAVAHAPEVRIGGCIPTDVGMRIGVPGLYAVGRCAVRVRASVGSLASARTAIRSVLEDIGRKS